MTTLVIIADDLTGAADSAARCHHAGMVAHIHLDPAHPPLPNGAVALSSDSRFLPAAEAAQRVRALLAPLPADAAHWYKKIDSTLRGNIGAEIDAMLAIATPAGEQPCAMICPAFPAQGRGLLHGELVFSQHVGQRAALPTLLAQQTIRPSTLLALETVRGGTQALAEAIRKVRGQGAQLLVVDSLSDEDLNTVLAAIQIAHPHALLCGSAGLIEPLASSLVQQKAVIKRKATGAIALRRPILAVVGSGSVMAHHQIDALRSLSDIEIVTIQPDLPAMAALAEEGNRRRGWVVHLPRPGTQTSLEGPAARALVAQLAEVAVEAMDKIQPATLLLVGGDTTGAMLARLGVKQLTVVAELMPGIPLLEGVDDTGHRWHIITKAGNFGDELTLYHLFELT